MPSGAKPERLKAAHSMVNEPMQPTADFDPKAGPVVIIGAGGAARGAAAAFQAAGAPQVRIVNRTIAKAEFVEPLVLT